MSFIASECSISKRTLYEIFPSKLDLFAELAILHRDAIINTTDAYEDLPLEQALIRMFRADLDNEDMQQQAAEVRLFYLEASSNPELGRLLKKHCGTEVHSALTRWVRRQAEMGRIVTDNPGDTAKFLLDVLIGAQVFGPKHADDLLGLSDVRTYMLNTIRAIVHGLSPRQGVGQ